MHLYRAQYENIDVDCNKASKPEKETPSGVIDLTGDEELSQALQASLNEANPNFGPSDRAPDPNWAMVSSNVLGPIAHLLPSNHSHFVRPPLDHQRMMLRMMT